LLALIAIGWLLVKVASKIIRFVGVVIVIGLVWFFWQGGTVEELKYKGVQALFRNTSVLEIEDRFCQTEKADTWKCQCLARPVSQDLQARFSEQELKEIDVNDELRLEEIRNSMRIRNDEIQACLKEKGVSGGKGIVDWVKEKTSEGK
jgi:hypothetical protein